VCVDESTASDVAFNQVLTLHKPNDLVILLHVVEPVIFQPALAFPPAPIAPILYPENDQVTFEARKHKAARLKKKFSDLCEVNHVKYQWREEVGDPVKKIKEVENEVRPNLLVFGSNNKNFFERAFLGSVSRHFSTHSDCPVLIVPQQAHK